MIEIHPTEQEVFEAIDRIARTRDGADLYVYLQRRLMSVSSAELDGALRSDHGERRFALKLIDLMRIGILESGGRTGSSGSTSGTSSAEQPFVVSRAEPVAVGSSAARAAARRTAIDAIDIGGTPRESGSKA